jgi:hypothetical protein
VLKCKGDPPEQCGPPIPAMWRPIFAEDMSLLITTAWRLRARRTREGVVVMH